MKTKFFPPFFVLAASVVFTATGLQAALTLEAGVAYARASGVRPYAARQNLSLNETSHVTVPTLRLAFIPSPRWAIGLGYSYYDNLESSGTSPSNDVFNDRPGILPIVVDVWGRENIHEMFLDGRYRMPWGQSAHVEFGPVLSLYQSSATIGSDLGRNQRSFSATDLRVGATAALTMELAPRWQLSASYRYSAPPERNLHLWGVALAFRL